MKNNNLTIFQKLTKVFGFQNGEDSLPTYKFNKDELLKTDSKEDYEKALLQAQQNQYLGDKWTKIDQSLYNQSVYYEPNRLSAYYDYESMEFTPEISASLDIYAEESCLDGSTIIPLLSGENISIDELYHSKKENFWVYGVSIDNDEIKPTKIEKVIYKGIKDVFKLTLDDDTEIICTNDHKWLTSNNTWIDVKNIKHGTSLKSIYQKIDKKGYEKISLKDSKYRFTHTIVGETLLTEEKNELKKRNEKSQNIVIHHKSFDKRNNEPEQLQYMLWNEHRKLHNDLNKEKWNNVDFSEKMRKIFSETAKKTWKNKKSLLSKKFSISISKHMSSLTPDERKKKYGRREKDNGMYGVSRYGKLNPNYNTTKNHVENINEDEYINLNFSIEKIKHFISEEKYPKIKKNKYVKINNIDKNDLNRFIRKRGYKDWSDIVDNVNNHRVVKIEYLGQNKVYDLVNSSIDSTFGVKCNNGMIISHNCTMSEKGEILTVYSESKRIKTILEDLFKNKLDINTNLQMWARGMCKYGDDFVYLKIDPEKGVVGCQQLPNIEIERVEGSSNDGMNTQLNTSTLTPTKELRFAWKNKDIDFQSWEMAHFRILGDDRKLPYGTCLKSDSHIKTTDGYKEIKDIVVNDVVYSFNLSDQKMETSKVLDTVKSGIKRCYRLSTKDTFIEVSKEHNILYYDTNKESFNYKNTLDFKVGDLVVIEPQGGERNGDNIYDLNDRLTSDFILEPLISIEDIGDYETHDIYVENSNHNFYANGIVVHNSMLDKIRRIWKQLLLAEDAMLIYRTSRAPERRVFKVFVGNMDDKDVEAYVQRIANKFKRDQIVDQRNGQVDMRYNQMAVDQDFFIPVRDLSQSSPIETLAGAQNLGEIADIEYIQKKLLAALRIPKAFLGFEEVVGDGKSLALMDIRFARTINRVQKSLIQELNKIAIVHLYILGLEDELHNFTLSLTNPSAQSDLLRIEQWKEKITLYKDATSDQSNIGIMPTSHTFAKKNILGLSDNEIILDLQQQRLERAIGYELTNTHVVIKRSGVFDNVDKKYGVPEEERQKNEVTQDSAAGVDGMGAVNDMGAVDPMLTDTLSEPLAESNFLMTEKKMKLNDLFDFNKAQRNIYEIENKLNDILKENQ